MSIVKLTRRFQAGIVAAALAVSGGVVSGVVGAAVSPAPPALAASGVGGPITRTEILSRAQYWVDHDVIYGTLYDDGGKVISTESTDDPAGKNYRTDCSGLVSMAWHLSSSLTTGDFANWSGVDRLGNPDSLLPGDAVLFPGHIELFAEWKDPANHSAGAWSYSLNGPYHRDWAKGPTGNSHNQRGDLSWSEITNNTLLRYKNISGSVNTRTVGDFDGDGRTDLALYRPDAQNGSSWWVKGSASASQIYAGTKYGGAGDIPVAGDFDGDGLADQALYRRDCTNGSTWWVKSTGTGAQLFAGTKYGGCNDIPAPGDYDGDGKTDLALYRPDAQNGSTWWVKSAGTGAQIYAGTRYGGAGDIPAPGDYDGDGKADLALYRRDCANGSSWWVKSTGTGAQLFGGSQYGGCNDTPDTSLPPTAS